MLLGGLVCFNRLYVPSMLFTNGPHQI